LKWGKRGAVLNGRDIGTVVFPDADVKFFLTAVPDERAQRRFSEECEQDTRVSFEATFADMIERDRRDSTRQIRRSKSPGMPSSLIRLDCLSDQVFEKMMAAVKEKSGGKPAFPTSS